MPVAEALTITSAAKAAKEAKSEIEKLFTDRDKLVISDAKYYTTYIEVASHAIKGLEAEYTEILLKAAKTDIKVKTQRDKLNSLINKYTGKEVFRPQLKTAIDHLKAGRSVLEKHTTGWFSWPSTIASRLDALDIYDRLLNDLTGYLGELGDYTGISAVGLDYIKELQGLLTPPLDQKAFAKRAEELLATRKKSKFFSVLENSVGAIEALRKSFR